MASIGGGEDGRYIEKERAKNEFHIYEVESKQIISYIARGSFVAGVAPQRRQFTRTSWIPDNRRVLRILHAGKVTLYLLVHFAHIDCWVLPVLRDNIERKSTEI